MKLRTLTGSFLAAAALLSTSIPAQAGPFTSGSGGVFKPANTQPAGNTQSTPATNAPVGNGEIQGLGDHQSWVDQKTLANDPRALCTDVGLGNNTRANSSDIASANSTSSRSNSSKSHNDGGGGGGSFLGIVSVSGNGSSQGSQQQSQSSDKKTNNSEKTNSNSSTVVKGKNCDAFVNSAAARDMNYQDNLTRRYDIKTGRRGQQVNQLIQDK
ncbi:hypothetical protein [Brunnivagina elsteri]|uniref:Uncharacterized protein n=1 Tax=Brunnivagina elsteri CCALA 953 TaxID=987040 RepID=A0A2A2TAI3_9CYAN|nr:hypothetical protein [Calothrix elsteri]PAX48306.1 hypothetical protein CK510_28275 [Calothrix elsteri CCALA 953]